MPLVSIPPVGRTLLAVLVVILAVALAHPASAEAAPAKAEQKLLRKINTTRASYGLPKLRFAAKLQRGAHTWAQHLLRRDSFHHASLSSGTRENIGWVTCRKSWAGKLIRLWLASPSHRTNLLTRGIRRAGVGVRTGSWRGYRCVTIAVTRFR